MPAADRPHHLAPCTCVEWRMLRRCMPNHSGLVLKNSNRQAAICRKHARRCRVELNEQLCRKLGRGRPNVYLMSEPAHACQHGARLLSWWSEAWDHRGAGHPLHRWPAAPRARHVDRTRHKHTKPTHDAPNRARHHQQQHTGLQNRCLLLAAYTRHSQNTVRLIRETPPATMPQQKHRSRACVSAANHCGCNTYTKRGTRACAHSAAARTHCKQPSCGPAAHRALCLIHVAGNVRRQGRRPSCYKHSLRQCKLAGLSTRRAHSHAGRCGACKMHSAVSDRREARMLGGGGGGTSCRNTCTPESPHTCTHALCCPAASRSRMLVPWVVSWGQNFLTSQRVCARTDQAVLGSQHPAGGHAPQSVRQCAQKGAHGRQQQRAWLQYTSTRCEPQAAPRHATRHHPHRCQKPPGKPQAAPPPPKPPPAQPLLLCVRACVRCNPCSVHTICCAAEFMRAAAGARCWRGAAAEQALP